MKKIVLLTALCVSTLVSAQSVNYEITYNNPEIRPIWILNADVLDMDIFLDNVDGAAFNLGVWGSIEPVPRIGIDYRIRRSWLTLATLGGDVPPNFKFELGGYFSLYKSVKTRKVKVILDSKDSDRIEGNKKITTTTYTSITIPAKNQKELLVRGGFYHQSGPYGKDEPIFGDYPEITAGQSDYARISTNGVYAGLALRTINNVFIKTNTHGNQMNSIAKIWFLDALILGNTFTDFGFDTDITEAVKAAREPVLPIGFRLGFTKHQIEKKTYTDKKFGLAQTYEIGYRPYQGFYTGVSLSITFVKMIKKAGDD